LCGAERPQFWINPIRTSRTRPAIAVGDVGRRARGHAPEDLDVLKRNRNLGVTRMTVRLPPAKEGEILPILDRWAKLIQQVKN
jgi:hypothetical protein